MNRQIFTKSLKIPMQILTILGQWRPKNSKLSWLYSLFVLFTIQIPLTTLPVVNLLVDDDVSFVRVANSVFLNIQTAVVPFKTIFLAFSQKKILKAFELLESEVFNSYNRDHITLIQDGALVIKRISHYITLCFVTALLMAATPVVYWKERRLFVDMWFPFDPTANWFYYLSAHTFSSIGK